MDLRIGDKIVHAVHGPGIVRDIRILAWDDVPCEYYLVEIPSVKMQIYLRVGESWNHLVRPALAAEQLPMVMRILCATPQPLPETSPLRRAMVERRLERNDPTELAMLVRDLKAFLRTQKVVRAGDEQLWRHAWTRLCAEWALAADISCEAARSDMECALNVHQRKRARRV